MRLSLYEHPHGYEPTGAEPVAGARVVYDIAADEAHFGAARVDGPALRWELEADDSSLAAGAVLSERLAPPAGPLIVRCDRIDFPPGGVAYRHTHPGPGIRRLLFGSIRIDADGHIADYGPGDAWFESGPSPVHATASTTQASAFVRVMLLPAEWEGKRTISYVDPADAEKPKLQSARVYFDRVIAQ
jgi:quercetin dioxygenase-like cupin family protein